MSKTTNIYIDTEFTGLTQHTSLISLALVDEHGKFIYFESNNYSRSHIDQWLAENVIQKLFILKDKHFEDVSVEFGFATGFINQKLAPTIVYTEDETSIKDEIDSWVACYEEVQFVSDCKDYDWVLFCQLFGGALKLPDYICPYCHDLNQDIARVMEVGDREAFDYNRERLAFKTPEAYKQCQEEFYQLTSLEKPKHNALWDAFLIKEIYRSINA